MNLERFVFRIRFLRLFWLISALFLDFSGRKEVEKARKKVEKPRVKGEDARFRVDLRAGPSWLNPAANVQGGYDPGI